MAPLPDRLKTATRSLHTTAERAPLMSALLRGTLGLGAYRELLVNLRVIYAALERALDDHRTHPAIAPIWLPPLARAAAIERDLAALPTFVPSGGVPRTSLSGVERRVSPSGAAPVASSSGVEPAAIGSTAIGRTAIVSAAIDTAAIVPAATDYADRLQRLARDEPHRLVGHAYVRYLGDLSGGQLLHRIVADKLGGPVAFYDFGSAAEVDALRVAFRDGLARIALDEHETDAVVDEAVQAFERHVALFNQLSTH